MYQIELARASRERNILAVLPTGLGKTAIALLLIAQILSEKPDSRCLLLAPTRVLVHQHFTFLCDHLQVDRDEIGVLTGEDTFGDRKSIWSKRVVCATPQVMASDLRRGNCDVSSFDLIVFDEAHRAVGNHAYCTIGAMYHEARPDGRVLGMTASLPSDQSKVQEIISKLNIAKVEVRDEKDQDVKPYVFKTEVEWIELQLSPELANIQKLMKDALDSRLKLLEDAGLIKQNRYGSITLRDLLRLRMKVDQIQSSQLKSALFSGIRTLHALNLLETQSLNAYKAFMDRLVDRRRGYGMGELLNDTRVRLALERANAALNQGLEHPKIAQVLKLCEKVKSGERAIIFASYRDTVDQIYGALVKAGFKAGYLIGKSGKTGQSQKKQVQALEELRSGTYDILVATQVGEEGLDVAECNLVIFYDNVPSAVRFVQRKGRTGRKREGHMYVLITKGTRDEAYYWLSRRRMKDVRKVASALSLDKEKGGPLDHFLKGETLSKTPIIYVDSRELAQFVERLRSRGAQVEVKQLEIGDFVASSEVVIERKTTDDFVRSIFDGRLFKQLAAMTDKYSRPVLVVQGDYKQIIGIGESAFYGALASVISDFKTPVLLASSEREVAEIVYHIARREQLEKKRETRIREGRKPSTLAQNQRYIVSGIPGVDAVLADRLLARMSTIEQLFSASESELRDVGGIGEVMARRIRQLATAKYIGLPPSSGTNTTDYPKSEFFSEAPGAESSVAVTALQKISGPDKTDGEFSSEQTDPNVPPPDDD
jgi:ERCC4-related helicase